MTGFASLTASAVLLIIASAASAEEISAPCGGLVRHGPDARLCSGGAVVSFVSAGPDVAYALRVAVPRHACSDTSYIVRGTRPHFRRDAPVEIATTYRLQPGQSQTLPIGAGWGAGENTLMLGVVRYDGNCAGRAAMTWNAAVWIAADAS